MVKSLVTIIEAVFILLFLNGCGLSKDRIANTVKTSLQENLSSDPQYTEHNLIVKEIQVVKQNTNFYEGTAKIQYEGELHPIRLKITVDGSNITWDLEPGAFKFIPQFN